jgi:hypothetical protein
MIGMFHWLYPAPRKAAHNGRPDDTIIDVEAPRHPNQLRLEEARRRWIDKRTMQYPNDIDWVRPRA